jgi:hypothetical protein
MCNNTCETHENQCDDDAPLVSGCACKGSTVYDKLKDQCVEVSECGCQYYGESYKKGDKMKIKCVEYQCISGKWEKQDTTGEKCTSTCTVYGDPHFITFDNLHYTTQGDGESTCNELYLLREYSYNDIKIGAKIKNIPCGSLGATCAKAMEITYTGTDGVTHEFNLEHEEDGSHFVQYDGDDVLSFPTTVVDDVAILQVGGGFHTCVKFGYADMTFCIHIGLHVSLQFDQVHKNGGLQGMCGNFDGTTDTKTDVSDQSVDTCDYNVITSIEDHCKDSEGRSSWAGEQCGIITDKNGAFRDCIPLVGTGKLEE